MEKKIANDLIEDKFTQLTNSSFTFKFLLEEEWENLKKLHTN